MNKEEVLDLVLKSYMRYYDINKETPSAPFKCEAVFKSHNEQYFLVKSAKLQDIDSNEYVFFALEDSLTKERLLELDKIAWEEGLSRVEPKEGHRNSDVTLIIISDRINQNAFDLVKKLKHTKSYKFNFFGWSNYRLVAMEISLNRFATNRQGSVLKKLFNNIKNSL